MQIKIVPNQTVLSKPFEQSKICSNPCFANNLPDSFTSSNGASIAFKGNVSNSLASKLLKFIQDKAPNGVKTTTSKLSELSEITSAKVAEKLNSQLAYFRLSDIGKIINSFASKDKELATLSLAHMSQWGRFESLNALASNLAKENRTLYSENRTCLANNIGYLKHKCSFKDLPFANVDDYAEIKGKGMILLDEFVLERLSKDKKLADFLKQNSDIQLCYPEGWIHGINPFNQTSKEEVGSILKRVTQQAKTLIDKKGMSANDAIGSVLNEPVVSQLEELGLKDRLKIIGGEKIDKDAVSLSDIAEQFKHRGINAEYLQRRLETELPKEYRQLMLGAINNEAQVFDSRAMSLMMQEQYKKILEIAKQKNITPENISYFVHKPNKSYGIIAQQFQATNKIHPSQFIDNAKDLSPSNLVVILDDYAGSGASLNVAAVEAIKHNNDIVISPIFSTNYAIDKLKQFDCPEDFISANVIPFKTVENFKRSTFYQTRPQQERGLLDKAFVGETGINSDTSIAFPHMSPDNNHTFFNEFIAPQYLLNGNGAKFDTYHWQQIKNNILTGNFYPEVNA